MLHRLSSCYELLLCHRKQLAMQTFCGVNYKLYCEVKSSEFGSNDQLLHNGSWERFFNSNILWLHHFCAAFKNLSFVSIYHISSTRVPVYHQSYNSSETTPCELLCKVTSINHFGIYGMVEDGTPCIPGGLDICSNGKCQVRQNTASHMSDIAVMTTSLFGGITE